ncbi:MAG: DUF1284 domain-containing protein [Pseudomonadota bacterium]
MLCALSFEGKGYDSAFVANMAHIVWGQLQSTNGSKTPVRITGQADSICAPCPRRRDMGCDVQDKIDTLDARHGAALGLAPGDQVTWGDCVDRVVAQVEPDDLDHLCQGCEWLDLGVCKAAVAQLLSDKKGRPPEEAALPAQRVKVSGA